MLYALDPGARLARSKVDTRRERVFAWRPTGERRAWALPTEIDGGGWQKQQYGVATNVQLSRAVASGDEVVLYDPSAIAKAGGVSGCAIVGRAVVERVEFTTRTQRTFVFKPGSLAEADGSVPINSLGDASHTVPRRPTRIVSLPVPNSPGS